MASKKVHGLLFEKKNLNRSYKLNDPASSERGELEMLTYINTFILQQGGPITITIGGYEFQNIYGANKLAGTPKADVALVAYNEKTKKFENVCYISHKSEGLFPRYGGVTQKADGAKAGAISKHKEVTAFLKAVEEHNEDITKRKKRYYRVIKDPTLVGRAVYGPEFGKAKFNEDNVHLVGHGHPKLVPYMGNFALRFSSGATLSPGVSKFMRGEYKAVLEAAYEASSSYAVGGHRHKGVRISIVPVSKVPNAEII